MSNKEILSLFSIMMNFASSTPYVVGICRRQTKPHMFSWIIWGILCGTVGAIQSIEGGAGSWMFILNSFYCFGIAITSIWMGTKDIKRVDWIVLFLALSAIPLWALTKTPIWSVFMTIAIDGMAYIPTVRKSWNKPFQESALSWSLGTITILLSILALEKYSLATYLYPATFMVVNIGLVIFLLARRKVVGAEE